MVWSMFMLCLVHFSALSPELSNSISYPDAFAIYDQPLVSVQRSAERDWSHCWRHCPELCCCYVQTVFVILNTCKENCWKAARGGPNRAEQWPPSRSTARSFRLVTYRVCLLYVCVHVGHHVVGYVCVYIYQEGHFYLGSVAQCEYFSLNCMMIALTRTSDVTAKALWYRVMSHYGWWSYNTWLLHPMSSVRFYPLNI